MIKYYHWIVEKIATGERFEIVKRGQPKERPGYRIIGCCGYHEKQNNN